jgi:predicted alpha/beta-fold hydrolase
MGINIHSSLATHKYYAPWYLSNGHLQTLQLSNEMKSVDPLVAYERQILDMPDGGIISLDWALPPRADGTIPRVSEIDPTRRTMLLLPGLTGGSGEFYIRSVAKRMVSLGWQVVVMNARGCADTPLKTAQFFCVAYTEDLRHVVRHFHAQYQFTADTFIAVGFSLGSNVLVKYLAEERGNARPLLHAGISVGNPFDIVACSDHLVSTFFYRTAYDATLNRNLLELFFHRSNAHEVFAHHPQVDLQWLRQATTVAEFDDRFTRRVFNYESVHHFYSDASSGTRIQHVQVALLCLNAADDPISTAGAIPFAAVAENPHVILCVTRGGGHLAFYEGDHEQSDAAQAARAGEKKIWSVRAIAEFAESVRAHQRAKTAEDALKFAS